MLLFRSEENVAAWCRARGNPVRPLIRLDQLWHLAVTWYANRLTVDSRRPAPDEMVAIFAEVGLEGPFWDPKADRWGSAAEP
jgi:hypothetical protein